MFALQGGHAPYVHTSAYRAGPVAVALLSTVVTAALIIFLGLSYIDFEHERPKLGAISNRRA
jgi:hypothetical protein